MADAGDGVTVQFGANLTGLLAGLETATAGIEEFADTVTSVSSLFTGFGEALITAFAVRQIEEFVTSITQLGEQALRTSEMLGESTEAVTGFQFAAEMVGQSGDAATMGLVRLERQMEQAISGNKIAQSAFTALGLSMDQLKTMTPTDVIAKMADAFAAAPDGPNKTAIAMALMGRTGAQMIPVLDQGSAGLAAMTERAKEAGVVLSQETAQGLEETQQRFTELGQASTGVGITIVEAFKPAIDDVVSSMISWVEGINNLLRTESSFNGFLALIVAAVDTAIGAFYLFTTVVKDVTITIVGMVTTSATALNTLGRVSKDAVTLNWGDIASDWDTGMKQLTVETNAFTEASEKTWDEYAKHIESLFSNITASGYLNFGQGSGQGRSGPPGLEQKDLGKLATVGAGAQDPVAAWKEQLQQMIDSEGQFFQDSKAQEVAFWQAKLATLKEGSKEYNQVYALLYDAQKSMADKSLQDYTNNIKQQQAADGANYATKLTLQEQLIQHLQQLNATDTAQYREALNTKAELLRQETAQEVKLTEDNNKTQYDILKASLDQRRTLIEDEFNAKQITAKQEQQMLTQLYQDEYAAAVAYYTKKAELDKNDVTAQNEDNNEILLAKSDLDNKIADLNSSMLKDQTSAWTNFVSSISSQMDTMVDSVLRGTQTMSQAFGRFLGDMLLSWANDITKMTIQWLGFEAGIKGIQNPFAGGGVISGLLGGAGAAAAGPSLAEAALTNAITGQTAATVQNTGGIFNWIGQQLESLAQFFGLATATTVQTTATTAATAVTGTGLIPALVALTTAVTANTVAQAGSGGGSAAGGGLGLIGAAIPFLESGGDILSPGLAILHAGERVQPAKATGAIIPDAGALGSALSSEANFSRFLGQSIEPVLRAVAEGGGAGTPVTFEIHAIDTQSGMQFIDRNARMIAQKLAAYQKINPSVSK